MGEVSSAEKRFYIRFRLVFLTVLFISAFIIILNFENIALLFLVALLFILISLIILLLGYHFTIDADAGLTGEMFFGKVLRQVRIPDIQSVEQRFDKLDEIMTILSLGLRTGYVTTAYTIKGNFLFKFRFPLIPVSYKLLDELIRLNNGLMVDPYFASVLSKDSRDSLRLKVTPIDKIANLLGYFLYTLLFILFIPFCLFIVVYILSRLGFIDIIEAAAIAAKRI